MAKIIENNCVGCPQGCVQCGRKEEEVIICDNCEDFAEFRYENTDYCEDCFNDELIAQFYSLSVKEKAEALSITYEKLG